MTSARVETILVVGPALSGAAAVAAALRRRLTGCHVIEAGEALDAAGRGVPPDVVVFVVSAAAPMAHCDAVLLDVAAARTDAVVAAVAKIDVHRTWRGVMESNRAVLARHASRYGGTAWVGVAADPRTGPPVIAPLVEAVLAVVGDSRRAGRNQMRAAGYAAARRREHAAQRNALRAQVRHTRLDLAARARAEAVSLRAELQQCAAVASDIGGLDEQVHSRVSRAAGEFDDLIRRRFAELCRVGALPVPDVGPAAPVWDGLPAPHRPAKDSVTVVFAGTFGLGVALTLGRLVREVAGGASAWGLSAGGAVGLAVAMWVVRARRLTAARLASQRWVGEVCAGLRSILEERVLAAESSLLAAIAADGRRPD